MNKTPVNTSGFSMLELLVVVAILGIVMVSLQGILSQFLQTHQATRQEISLLNNARFAVDRMITMVGQTGFLDHPAVGNSDSELRFEERVMDTVDNTDQSIVPGGDGYFDADNNANGRVNDLPGSSDPVELVTYKLDTSDASNWKLVEILPDYTTSNLSDVLDPRELCEQVIEFTCLRLSNTLVEIVLVLENGIHTARIKTRAVAARVKS